MGLGGISMWQLLIVLLIVVLIFGTKRLKSIGGDLGGAVKGFRSAMSEAEQAVDEENDKLKAPDAEFSEAESTEQAENKTSA